MTDPERVLLMDRLRALKIAAGRAELAVWRGSNADLFVALAEVVVRYEAARRSPPTGWDDLTGWNDPPVLAQKERTDG